MRRTKKTAAAHPLVPHDVGHTLAAHQSTHGDFAECARISQTIMRALRSGSRWNDLSDVQVEALQMISHKLHRIVCGDPNHADHFHDVAGYAVLAERDIERKKKEKP